MKVVIFLSLIWLFVDKVQMSRITNNQTTRSLQIDCQGKVTTDLSSSTNYQNWTIEKTTCANGSINTYLIKNTLNGVCLDSNSKGDVYTLVCNGGDYQKWQLLSGNRILNCATNLTLDSNYKGYVYTLPLNGGNYQNWQIEC